MTVDRENAGYPGPGPRGLADGRLAAGYDLQHAGLRDWRAGAILLGFLAGWLTWFPSAFSERTMFLFYATPLIPFMVLAVVLVLGYLIGPAPAGAAGAHAALPGEASPGRTGLGETGPGETGRGGEGYPLPGEPYRDAGPHGGGGAHATPAPVQGAVQGAGMRRLVGSAAAGAFLLVVLANFAYFYPILAAQTLPYDEWHARIWFQSWV